MKRRHLRQHLTFAPILGLAFLAIPATSVVGQVQPSQLSGTPIIKSRIITSSDGGTVTITTAGASGTVTDATTPEGTAAAAAAAEQKNPLLEAFKQQPVIRTASAVFDHIREKAASTNAPDQTGPPRNPDEVIISQVHDAVLDGDWAAVEGFLERFEDPKTEAREAYLHLLNSLVAIPPPRPPRQAGSPGAPNPFQPQPQPQMMVRPEPNIVTPEDVLALADMAPGGLDAEIEARIAQLLQAASMRGFTKEKLLANLETGTSSLGGSDPERRLAAARVLATAGFPADAEAFLPPAEQARSEGNAAALNLRSRILAARHATEGELALLEQAWTATQDVLALGGIAATDRDEALARAIELAPRVSDRLGKAWLLESFTTDPERGIEILSSLGASAAGNRGQIDAQFRRRILDLQHRAVGALAEAAPDRLDEWSRTLTLLALNWLHEGEWSFQRDQSTTRGPQLNYDRFGNVYYSDDPFQQQQMMMQQNNREPQPIPTGDLLKIAPDEAWLGAVDPALHLRFLTVLADLNLKIYDEEAAFPYVERVAQARPDEGKRLAERFLSVWTDNHDPNQNTRRTNRFMYVYGYNPGLDAIPLTRSKQERNLADLAEWVKKLRALPIDPLDEALVAQAFVRTHSTAEVYRLENIEKVFGSPESLAPKTLAELTQTMRRNLATVWRNLKTQQEAKTNRTDKEMLAEVARGYAVADTLLDEARAAHPADWRLQLAHASFLFDRNNFESEHQGRSPEFSANRDRAFEAFAKAAELYAAALPSMPDDEKSGDVHLNWFYASLGATDLEAVAHDQQPDPRQYPRIREAMLTLPGEAADDHMTRFANALSTRINAVQPALKHRYLGAGLEIAGEHERAQDARDLHRYYADLVSEVQLHARLDGPDVVGHREPFGLYVDIRHTDQIEREAGGFNRYLQNQNNYAYYYNFGRPNENYRDKFEEAARATLAEHFEVLSITFHSDKTVSRGDPEEGWRVTPYAHLLLRPKGPEVDAVPSLDMSLDFMDTSGYVVLPIASAKIPIDARPEDPAPRPFRDLVVTQILDERKAAEGILGLEIKATAHGLVPDLPHLLDLDPREFDVVGIEDQGVAVSELDSTAEHENTVVTERLWTVSMKAKPGLAQAPGRFEFARLAEGLDPEPKSEFFRYEDADLAEAQAEIPLEQAYEDDSFPWMRAAAATVGGLVLIALILLAARALRRRPSPGSAAFELPGEINPLSVIGLLRRIRTRARFDDETLRDLDRTIQEIESRYYQPRPGSPPIGPVSVPEAPEDESSQLERTAREWLKRAA